MIRKTNNIIRNLLQRKSFWIFFLWQYENYPNLIIRKFLRVFFQQQMLQQAWYRSLIWLCVCISAFILSEYYFEKRKIEFSISPIFWNHLVIFTVWKKLFKKKIIYNFKNKLKKVVKNCYSFLLRKQKLFRCMNKYKQTTYTTILTKFDDGQFFASFFTSSSSSYCLNAIRSTFFYLLYFIFIDNRSKNWLIQSEKKNIFT